MNTKILFVVWYGFARRAETLSREIGAQVVYIYAGRLKKAWLTPLRYLVQAGQTWRLLERERPAVVLVQSPPVFAPLVVAIWCKFRGKSGRGHSARRVPYVIDCHPGTFYHSQWVWALPLLRLLSRGAAVTLLCNEDALDILRSWKVRGIFLPDGLPSLPPATSTIGSEGEARVAMITVFANDEPVAEVFEAARMLPHVTFYLTGDPKRATPRLLTKKPENVVLTGFLRGGVYSGLLNNVNGTVVLTNVMNSLNCGAYEAMSLAKPTILTDWPEMRRCFKHGFIYVTNTPESIAAGVKQLLNEQESLTTEIAARRTEYVNTRQPKFEEFAALLRGISC